MIQEKKGRVIRGLGGLFDVRIDGGEVVSVRAKGSLKRDEEKLFVGDMVALKIDDAIPDSAVISSVCERKNSLIRPPLSNLDYLYIVFAAKKPTPVIETVDKLIAIAEHNYIEPIIIITKNDIDFGAAQEYADIYKSAGMEVFVTSSEDGAGISELSLYIKEKLSGGKVAAFSGASGVGKSTLMNALFPELSLATGKISEKIERGKHTTRHVELFAVSEGDDTGFLADTPGFSLIDFERFNFFDLEDLALTFREFTRYRGTCRYSDCAHVGEGADECAIAAAAERGEIAKSRLESYRSIYRVLKNKTLY